jgi:hypothetical protein
MKITDMIKCHKDINTGEYIAWDVRNNVRIRRQSRDQAIRQVAALLLDQFTFTDPSYRYSKDGTLWVFRYMNGSWGYDIVHQNKEGCPNWTTVVLSEPREEAYKAITDHLIAYNKDIER